jgi:sugar phosphate isomerase/epimerase
MKMNTEWKMDTRSLSRRDFIQKLGLGSAGLALAGSGRICRAAEGIPLPIVIFSKAYQPLKLSFEQAAEFTAESGLDGVDCPVRPDGEIVPERAADDLPVYVGALRKQGRSMPYITTAITSVDSPKTETVLRTAKKLGVERYRLGFIYRSNDEAAWQLQLREVRAHLKDLAALNKEIGIGAVVQNHSPAGRTYVGGNLDDLAEIVEGFDAEQVGVAFDIAHALNVHGPGWRERFDKIKSHLKVVYVKDVNREKRFVPLGQGDVGATGYFKLVKQLGYHAPICLHIEYSESPKSQPDTRADLLNAVKESLLVLRRWLE